MKGKNRFRLVLIDFKMMNEKRTQILYFQTVQYIFAKEISDDVVTVTLRHMLTQDVTDKEISWLAI